MDPLGVISDAHARAGETLDLASRYLDPSLVEVLRILGFDKAYRSASGSYLYDADGRAYLDMHSGEGFASLGHGHPDIRAVLQAMLDTDLVDGVQLHYSVLAGMLAEALAARLPEGLDATFFASTGAEAVDSAMKFARAATGRPRFVSCDSSFHGVTLGPLSIVGDDFFKEGFGPLLPGCVRVPYGDLGRLEVELRSKDVAAFIVEPIQGRLVTLPPPGYLEAAQELCRKYGTLFVIDEIQTGLGRTGEWFALDHWRLQPDIVTVGKALSGGYMPVAAMVTRREIFQKAVGSLERSYVHQSTYGRNRLSMAAGLASLRVIERDGLVGRSLQMGGLLVDGLRELQQRHELVKEIRGAGMMIGIELQAPSSRKGQLGVRMMRLASEGLFPQLLVIPLHRDHGVITMAAGKNDVIKLLPPLTLSDSEAREFLGAFDAVLSDCEGDSGKNWSVVRDIAVSTMRRRESEPAAAFAGTQFSGKRVDLSQDNVCLVTGASGFIGGRLARRLVAEGYQVRCLVRSTSDLSGLAGTEVEFVTGDLTAPESLARAVEGCRYVFHCGAVVSDWGSPEEIRAVNVKGTRDLVDACRRASVKRFVHLSSTDVYGYPGGADVDEGYAGNGFRNWYSQTKRDAEDEVTRASAARAAGTAGGGEAAEDGGLETVILRPATVYGPGSREVMLEIARAVRGRRMLLIEQGRALAGLCYIDNLLDAAVLAMSRSAAVGGAFNVSDGLDVTWRQLAAGLADGLGSPRPRLSLSYKRAERLARVLEEGYRVLHRTTGLTMRPLLSRQAVHVMGIDQSFSTTRVRETLGWEPRVDYAAGLAATLQWLRSEGL